MGIDTLMFSAAPVTGIREEQTHVITRESGLKTLARSIECKNWPSIARLKSLCTTLKEQYTAIQHRLGRWSAFVGELQKDAPTLCESMTGG